MKTILGRFVFWFIWVAFEIPGQMYFRCYAPSDEDSERNGKRKWVSWWEFRRLSDSIISLFWVVVGWNLCRILYSEIFSFFPGVNIKHLFRMWYVVGLVVQIYADWRVSFADRSYDRAQIVLEVIAGIGYSFAYRYFTGK